MTSRYQKIQNKVRDGHSVYMPYILMGYPSVEHSIEAAITLLDSGADGLELGLPFRDPVADGPVIQDAANKALDAGFKANDALKIIAAIRAHAPEAVLTLMSYYNIILAKGEEPFLKALAQAGIDGILIPDLPPEHAEDIHEIAKANKLDLIFIAAPTTSKARMEKITPYAGGFIYVVTKMGITGINDNYDGGLEQLFSLIKKNTTLPAIAGFGISTPGHAKDMIKNGANGVIIGSKIIQMCSALPFSTKELAVHTSSIVSALKE